MCFCDISSNKEVAVRTGIRLHKSMKKGIFLYDIYCKKIDIVWDFLLKKKNI